MSTRIQAMALAIGVNKQIDIATVNAAQTYMRVRKLDMGLYASDYQVEDDAAEIGKGNEFASDVFPTQWEYAGDIQKFGSAEFTLWAWLYALGDVTLATGLYTGVPIDPGDTLELPYFPMVVQLNEAGAAAVDELQYGNIVSNVNTIFESGTGRRTVMTNVRFVGSGKNLSPSLVTIPATVQSEKYMLSASMAATINGVDYVAGKGLVRGSLGFNNNPMLDTSYYPGSGTQEGAAIRGRIEVGTRVPTVMFEARLKNNSAEFAALKAQTAGTAVITLTFDATHFVTWTWHQVRYRSVVRDQSNGLAIVRVDISPQFHPTNGLVTVTGKCDLTDIAQV